MPPSRFYHLLKIKFMLSWFTESALIPMVVGTALVFCFLGFAFAFRNRAMLYIALVILALTAGTAVTERLIVTDKEAVQQTVREIVTNVEDNDLTGLLEYVSKKREDTRSRLKANLPRYVVTSCRITGFKNFEITQESEPKTAVIDFVVFAHGTRKSDGQMGRPNPQVTLTFEKESDGQWRIVNYSYSNPRGNLKL